MEGKTASVGLRREQVLPLIVPWEGIVNEDWIKIFLEVYQKCGLDLTRQPLGPHFCLLLRLQVSFVQQGFLQQVKS